MPSIRAKNSFQRARVSNRQGAGEPPGETAPPPGILDSVPDDIRRQLPDDVVDELLAGARTEEEIIGLRPPRPLSWRRHPGQQPDPLLRKRSIRSLDFHRSIEAEATNWVQIDRAAGARERT